MELFTHELPGKRVGAKVHIGNEISQGSIEAGQIGVVVGSGDPEVEGDLVGQRNDEISAEAVSREMAFEPPPRLSARCQSRWCERKCFKEPRRKDRKRPSEGSTDCSTFFSRRLAKN